MPLNYTTFAAAMAEETVILVDESDKEIGKMKKLEAHETPPLHRAVSVFVFNSKQEMLLQRRALGKYHSAGLWSNTTCSHPRPGENEKAAAERRLKEEMGISIPLHKKFEFIYKAVFENGLTEHEYDHVFFGFYNEAPEINTDEVSDWKWIGMDKLNNKLQLHPEQFTAWFRIIMQKHGEKFRL